MKCIDFKDRKEDESIHHPFRQVFDSRNEFIKKSYYFFDITFIIGLYEIKKQMKSKVDKAELQCPSSDEVFSYRLNTED